MCNEFFYLMEVTQWKLHLCLFLLNPKSYQNKTLSNTGVLYDKHVFGSIIETGK